MEMGSRAGGEFLGVRVDARARPWEACGQSCVMRTPWRVMQAPRVACITHCSQRSLAHPFVSNQSVFREETSQIRARHSWTILWIKYVKTSQRSSPLIRFLRATCHEPEVLSSPRPVDACRGQVRTCVRAALGNVHPWSGLSCSPV
jgi:hypothetical protein